MTFSEAKKVELHQYAVSLKEDLTSEVIQAAKTHIDKHAGRFYVFTTWRITL